MCDLSLDILGPVRATFLSWVLLRESSKTQYNDLVFYSCRLGLQRTTMLDNLDFIHSDNMGHKWFQDCHSLVYLWFQVVHILGHSWMQAGHSLVYLWFRANLSLVHLWQQVNHSLVHSWLQAHHSLSCTGVLLKADHSLDHTRFSSWS